MLQKLTCNLFVFWYISILIDEALAKAKKPLHLSNEPKSFGYRYSFCRAPWSMTKFARKQYRNAVIRAIYPFAGMWLVRDIYPYAAIWMVRNTYPNAVIWLVCEQHTTLHAVFINVQKMNSKRKEGKQETKHEKFWLLPRYHFAQRLYQTQRVTRLFFT